MADNLLSQYGITIEGGNIIGGMKKFTIEALNQENNQRKRNEFYKDICNFICDTYGMKKEKSMYLAKIQDPRVEQHTDQIFLHIIAFNPAESLKKAKYSRDHCLANAKTIERNQAFREYEDYEEED